MGWTYQEYESQPPFFIDEIIIFMQQEALKLKETDKKPIPKKAGIGRF